MSEFKFSVGDKVFKLTGDYNFPGEVRSCFRTHNGSPRYVVEAIGSGYEGMLHIFNEAQIGFSE